MLQRARHAFGLLLAPLRRALHYATCGSRRPGLAGLALLAALGAGGGFLYAWSGLVSIAASSGHWPVTAWFLHFSMRSAVRTQSLGIKVPPLDDAKLVLKGAGHFENGCSPCHGAPGQPRALIARQMVPEPPELAPRMSRWEPEELFWIVRNGIKFSAMPAWPAQGREDEVWAVVAFLRQLPKLDAEGYRELAYGPGALAIDGGPPDHLRPLSEPLGPVLASCVRCHGKDGNGRGEGAFPRLAGQNEAYLLASLRAYAAGERHSGIMQPIAAGLDEDSMRRLASHYAALPGSGSRAPVEKPEVLRRGQATAMQGHYEQGTPSCADCHGPDRTERNPLYPEIAGQYADYLALQLELFKLGTRGGTAYAHIMHSAARRLTAEQILEVANFYASLKPQADADEALTSAGKPPQAQ